MPSLNMPVQRLTIGLTLLWASNPFRGNLTTGKSRGVDLLRDFWIPETGTGQQVAQLNERYI